MSELFLLLIAFSASVIGSVCGVGGGVFMKPILDMTGIATVSTASFLSGMTVLAMTGYTTIKNLTSGNKEIDVKHVAPLALGAAIGGVAGKYLFELMKTMLPNTEKVGAVQAVCLGAVALGTAVYTINKRHIKTLHIESLGASALIGIILGIMSSFLGIGGGPVDLVVLFFFFSMDTKTAVQNSLFTILFSQAFSLIYTVASGNVPEFSPVALGLMICGGILGGMIGRKISRKLSGQLVDRLFIYLLIAILGISVFNFFKYI